MRRPPVWVLERVLPSAPAATAYWSLLTSQNWYPNTVSLCSQLWLYPLSVSPSSLITHLSCIPYTHRCTWTHIHSHTSQIHTNTCIPHSSLTYIHTHTCACTLACTHTHTPHSTIWIEIVSYRVETEQENDPCRTGTLSKVCSYYWRESAHRSHHKGCRGGCVCRHWQHTGLTQD